MIISLSGLSTPAMTKKAANDTTKLTHNTISCCLSDCFWTYIDLTDQTILPSAATPSVTPITSLSLFDKYSAKLGDTVTVAELRAGHSARADADERLADLTAGARDAVLSAIEAAGALADALRAEGFAEEHCLEDLWT